MPSKDPNYKEDPVRKDRWMGLYFDVEIDGLVVASFTECSGLTVETETFEYAEGGNNAFTYKLPVRTKYSNITLKRGLDPGHDLYSWYIKTLDGKTQRRNVTIKMYDSLKEERKSWSLMQAFPVKWTGPDLKADAGAVAVESVEFAHHGLNLQSDSQAPPTT